MPCEKHSPLLISWLLCRTYTRCAKSLIWKCLPCKFSVWTFPLQPFSTPNSGHLSFPIRRRCLSRPEGVEAQSAPSLICNRHVYFCAMGFYLFQPSTWRDQAPAQPIPRTTSSPSQTREKPTAKRHSARRDRFFEYQYTPPPKRLPKIAVFYKFPII